MRLLKRSQEQLKVPNGVSGKPGLGHLLCRAKALMLVSASARASTITEAITAERSLSFRLAKSMQKFFDSHEIEVFAMLIDKAITSAVKLMKSFPLSPACAF